MDKFKYILPTAYSISQVKELIMKYSKIDKEKFLTISVGKKICKANQQLGELYSKEKDEDGFLYLTVSMYPGFGWFNQFG